MGVPWRFLVTNLLLILPTTVNSYFEFCSNGIRYIIKYEDCPGGVIFQNAVPISKCFQPITPATKRNYLETVCNPDTDKLSNQIQYVNTGSDDNENDETCESICGGNAVTITKENTKGEIELQNLAGSEEDDSTPPPVTEDLKIKNQTLRLFMYMTGNLIDENEGGPLSLSPLLNILSQSFSIVRARVDKTFLPEAFLNDIQKAFLFLLRESETTKIKLISKQEVLLIKAALDSCKSGSSPMQPLYFSGRICATSAKVKAYAKAAFGGTRNTSALYSPNEYSFRWGYRDLVEEATWAVMDFVHGYCYGGFSVRVNNHHLYQRAMERLFTQELLHRWRNPQQLQQDLYWDNIFSTNVKVAMRNLDAAVQAAYLDSPFIHRLKRPWILMGDAPDKPEAKRRKKREAQVPAWCLTDIAEKNKFQDKLGKASC
ncbi:unnamed protein product [Allacma fusca]|uniref:Uncharacterized protein n=1 Tax=Allacma fusca TaxID=39272 RepID=A0A8J2KYY3_9HEXA|nr:unnamed protein product [Allacma fusca]